jgi:hypothetical protein
MIITVDPWSINADSILSIIPVLIMFLNFAKKIVQE